MNLHYGQDPGVKFYTHLTHLSDQFGPYHTKVITATANEAPHVLDGLLYHQISLVSNELYTDTGGFSDYVFAMCRLLGFRFAPSIRDLKEKRLYLLPGTPVPPELASMMGGTINIRCVHQNGTVTASVIHAQDRGLSPAKQPGARAARTRQVGNGLYLHSNGCRTHNCAVLRTASREMTAQQGADFAGLGSTCTKHPSVLEREIMFVRNEGASGRPSAER